MLYFGMKPSDVEICDYLLAAAATVSKSRHDDSVKVIGHGTGVSLSHLVPEM